MIEELNSYERRPISDTTRALLCNFAAGDLTRPLQHTDTDWKELFDAVCRNGLLGLTSRYLEHGVSRDTPPSEFKRWVQRTYRTSAMRMMRMQHKAENALAALADSSVDYLVTKGPVVAHMVYPDPFLRPFNDLDLVVRERDWPAMHEALVARGFVPEEDLPHPPPKFVPQVMLYELKYWHQETGLLVEVHYDDILNAGLTARDVEGFWQRANTVQIGGVLVKAMALEDQLIHLSMHVHYHGYTRLNWLSDIAFLVRDCGDQLDWERVLETVAVEGAQVGLYYTLYFTGKLLDVSAPEAVMSRLRPDRFRRWAHERYMPETKIVSLQPMLRPDFSFYFTPFFKRLLPDLLVMGRRGEKLRYLARLLVPPKDWLVYYYGLAPSAPVWMHYALHPLKLAYHVMEEVLGKLRAGLKPPC